jgi:hypothetical protein
MAKPERRDPAKERQWRQWLRRWRRSGLTGRDFCAEHGLSEPSFYAWRREIARRDQEKLASTRPAKRPLTGLARGAVTTRPPSGAAAGPAFVKVTVDSVVAPAPAIEVIVADRRVLRVRAGFDANLLRQLVRVLEEPAC